MNDGQYNEYIRRQLKDNEEKHFSEIEHNKSTVWERIEERLEKKKVVPIWYYSAAAVIIFMLGFGFIFYQQLNQKDIQIVYLQKQLENQQKENMSLKMPDNQVIIKTDTVRIERKEIVYVPVKTNETIVKHDTITNVVTVTDTVFVNTKAPLLFAKNENKDEAKVTENKVITLNQEPKQKNKNRRFIFQFGKPKNDVSVNESERLITLKTK